MLELRVTKYDPARRNDQGHYPLDDWVGYGEIGRTFAGVVLTRAEYERVEDAYVTTAIAFMREAGVATLTVRGLENSRNWPLPFGEGSSVDLAGAATALGRMLREEFWCRLERPDAFVHVGWDYYMYVDIPHPCPIAAAEAGRLGLFVEDRRSPYVLGRR